MNKRIKKIYKEEGGSVLTFSALIMVVLILFLGLAVDFGFYVVKYESVRSVAQAAVEEVQSMTGYYASIENPSSAFAQAVTEYVNEKEETTLSVSTSLSRSYSGTAGKEKADIKASVLVEDRYQTIFMKIVGIDSLPVRVGKNASKSFFLGERWVPGMPEELWTGP